MNKKWFIYPLITMAIATVRLLPAMEKMNNQGLIQITAQKRAERLLDVTPRKLQLLLSGFQDNFQDQDTASIVRKMVRTKDNKGWTLLMHLAKSKSLCEECTKNLELSCKHEEYQESLRNIYLKIAQLLITSGIDINTENYNGKSALMIAFNNKNEPIIELLLQSGVAIDVQDKDGFTPLHYAIKLGYDDIAFQLIKQGSLLDAKTKGTSYLREKKEYLDRETYFDLETYSNKTCFVKKMEVCCYKKFSE